MDGRMDTRTPSFNENAKMRNRNDSAAEQNM